jgi:hypothetical protein
MDIRRFQPDNPTIAAIRKVYGPDAQLVSNGPHAFDWKIRKGQQLGNVDFNSVFKALHGPRFRAATFGAAREDWYAIDFDSGRHEILPIIIVANEMFGHIGQVQLAKDNFKANIGLAQAWYRAKLGRTFAVVNEVMTIQSRSSGDQWNAWAHRTSLPDPVPPPKIPNRDVLLREQQGTLERAFGRRVETPSSIVCVGVYTGKGLNASGFGAINDFVGGHFSTQAPLMTEFHGPAYKDTEHLNIAATYSIVHELGHAFGLPHPDTRPDPKDPLSAYSIMGNPTNFFDKAILLDAEKNELIRSPFIR